MLTESPARRRARLLARLAAVSDWLSELTSEAACRPLSESGDLAALHGDLSRAKAGIERKLAELTPVDGDADNPLDELPDPDLETLLALTGGKPSAAEARRLINDACARVGRIAPEFVAIADDGRRVLLTWTRPEVVLVYSDLRAAVEAIEAG